MENYVVTVARGFGSGGKEVASKLAKSLGIHCYENRILTLASQLTGLDESAYVNADEKLQGSYLISRLREIPRAMHFIAVDRDFSSNHSLFEHESKIIRELVKHESCVIVGKCADYVLRDHPRKISVYIEASRPSCVARTIEKMGISEKEANQVISHTDKYRADYYKFYTNGGDWTSPVNYDLILNSDRAGIQGCVSLIRSYIQLKLPEVFSEENQ